MPHDDISVYDGIFSGYLNIADRILSTGERDLSRVLTMLEREIATYPLDPTFATLGHILSDATHHIPSFDTRMTHYLHRLFTREFLLRALPPDCDQIIEIGAGWGANLLWLWEGGGPRQAEYVALEPSNTGRDLGLKLAALGPIKYRADTVDLDALDIGKHAGGRKVFLFTCCTLTVSRNLPNDLFKRLTSASGICGGAHIEPGAWQRDATSIINARAREYDLKHGRNENLFLLLRMAEVAGRIKVDETIYNNHSPSPLLPVSLIRWTALGVKSENPR